jgi:hypothetical protein
MSDPARAALIRIKSGRRERFAAYPIGSYLQMGEARQGSSVHTQRTRRHATN